jgi:hypothetical protein
MTRIGGFGLNLYACDFAFYLFHFAAGREKRPATNCQH